MHSSILNIWVTLNILSLTLCIIFAEGTLPLTRGDNAQSSLGGLFLFLLLSLVCPALMTELHDPNIGYLTPGTGLVVCLAHVIESFTIPLLFYVYCNITTHPWIISLFRYIVDLRNKLLNKKNLLLDKRCCDSRAGFPKLLWFRLKTALAMRVTPEIFKRLSNSSRFYCFIHARRCSQTVLQYGLTVKISKYKIYFLLIFIPL